MDLVKKLQANYANFQIRVWKPFQYAPYINERTTPKRNDEDERDQSPVTP